MSFWCFQFKNRGSMIKIEKLVFAGLYHFRFADLKTLVSCVFLCFVIRLFGAGKKIDMDLRFWKQISFLQNRLKYPLRESLT